MAQDNQDWFGGTGNWDGCGVIAIIGVIGAMVIKLVILIIN